MEYVFGDVTKRGIVYEGLRTKGDMHTDLHGIVQIEREYDDGIVCDSFRIIEKYRSKTDIEGNCYDWYIIDSHYRYIDRSKAERGKIETELTEIEIAQIEQEQMITDHDIAIMELQDALNV